MKGYIYLRTNEWYQSYKILKMGIAKCFVDRESTYITSEPVRGKFVMVIEIPLAYMRTIDQQLKRHFAHYNKRFGVGGGTEYFSECIQHELVLYLDSLPIDYKVLSQMEMEKVERTQRLTNPKIKRAFVCILRHFQNKKRTRYTEFFQTFLPEGQAPRRIQTELWHLFEKICKEKCKYRGIVQWATGTGKTIATLILFMLSFIACKKEGIRFRGLFIAPTNDIFGTLIHHLRKLSHWSILVCEGHNAQLSSLQIPEDRDVLITATHASLTDNDQWQRLPNITHCHYDEVHRITGDIFYELLTQYLEKWNTRFLTGTSATPKTCITSQHKKIAELFGDPLRILHKCDVDEAISEKWIAQPRFGVNVIPKKIEKTDAMISIMEILRASIADKQRQNKWMGGKIIVYMPFRSDICNAVVMAKRAIPDAKIYTAVEDADAQKDDEFVKDIADGTPRILFACERYREGSDIFGLEMTVVLMGNTIGANIIVQIVGRALRRDYEGKEGWCIIIRPSEDGTSEDDVFDSIMLQIVAFIGQDIQPSQRKIREMVETYFGQVSITGKVYDVEETVRRIQSFYVRKEFANKEKYEVIRRINRDMGIQSKAQYTEHIQIIENPQVYFKDEWVSWYHFLGIDTDAYPQTKAEWIQKCRELGILMWQDYKEKYKENDLPENPSEMYEDYTNWDREIGTQDDYVW